MEYVTEEIVVYAFLFSFCVLFMGYVIESFYNAGFISMDINERSGMFILDFGKKSFQCSLLVYFGLFIYYGIKTTWYSPILVLIISFILCAIVVLLLFKFAAVKVMAMLQIVTFVAWFPVAIMFYLAIVSAYKADLVGRKYSSQNSQISVSKNKPGNYNPGQILMPNDKLQDTFTTTAPTNSSINSVHEKAFGSRDFPNEVIEPPAVVISPSTESTPPPIYQSTLTPLSTQTDPIANIIGNRQPPNKPEQAEELADVNSCNQIIKDDVYYGVIADICHFPKQKSSDYFVLKYKANCQYNNEKSSYEQFSDKIISSAIEKLKKNGIKNFCQSEYQYWGRLDAE